VSANTILTTRDLFLRIDSELSDDIPYDLIYSIVDYNQESFTVNEADRLIADIGVKYQQTQNK